jgi:integrase
MAGVIDRWAAETNKQNGKRWQVRWKDEHRRNRRRAFARKVDAERFAAHIQHQLDIGAYRDPRQGNVPFAEYAWQWFESQHQLRPATRTLYEGWLRNHLVPEFGSISLRRIGITQGRNYLNNESRTPNTRRRTFTLLRRIIDDAIAEQLIDHNPLTPLRLPKAPEREASFVTLKELERLVLATHPHFRTLIRTAAFLGLRQGELFGLHPDNVDLQARQVRVIEQLSAATDPPQRVEVKTQSSRRSVAVPGFLIPELHDQLEHRASQEFVFPAVEGGPIRKSNFTRRIWEPARQQAGLPELRFHELRHSAATFAIQAGAHPKAVQSRLGHSSIKVTLDRYGHLMPGADELVAENLDLLVAGAQHTTATVTPHPQTGTDLRNAS